MLPPGMSPEDLAGLEWAPRHARQPGRRHARDARASLTWNVSTLRHRVRRPVSAARARAPRQSGSSLRGREDPPHARGQEEAADVPRRRRRRASPRDGRIIETIGHYGPRQEPSVVDIDADRALDWLRKGAQPTEQVQKLLTVTGVWATFERREVEADRHEAEPARPRHGQATPAKKHGEGEPRPQRRADDAPQRRPRTRRSDAAEADAEAPRRGSRRPAEDAVDGRQPKQPSRRRRAGRGVRVSERSARLRRGHRHRRGRRLRGRGRRRGQPHRRRPRQGVVEHLARAAGRGARRDRRRPRGARPRRGLPARAREPADMGRLIGRRGRVIQAMRQVDARRRRARRREGRRRRRGVTRGALDERAHRPRVLEVGRIGRAARPARRGRWSRFLTDRPERTTRRVVVRRPSRATRRRPPSRLVVTEARPHQGRWLVRFEGVDDRDAAAALTGARALRRPSSRPPTATSSGCTSSSARRSSTRGGHTLGAVVAVEANPAHDLLVLDSGVLVPMVFVVEHVPTRTGPRVVVDPSRRPARPVSDRD